MCMLYVERQVLVQLGKLLLLQIIVLVVYFKTGKAGLQLLQNVDKIKSFK